jgi:energy-coupling factor transporter ATP-binding protein EcfA2
VPDENDLERVGLKVGTYKCFGETPQGFEQILPFNLIVGRNNTGKSALLDLLAYIVTRQSNELLILDEKNPEREKIATVVLRSTITSGDYDHIAGDFGDRAILNGRYIEWSLQPNGYQKLITVDETNLPQKIPNLFEAIAKNKPNPFRGHQFKRLSAERDIRPENRTPGLRLKPTVKDTGDGTTECIDYFLQKSDFDNTLVETTMLHDLNTIFAGDAEFTRIDTFERVGDAMREIYLYENHKGRVPLSSSGSGLKTIILVLVYLRLIPVLEGHQLDSYLFGFEELENNLHPALQRRLLHFLRAFATEHGCRFFLTTHSPVEIDYFARDEHAQVLHVTHDGKGATVATISAYPHRRRVLDDLDLRASDILQANGIIWVEGPSDRLYLNKWIELWTNGTLREGAHYQVLFYGGNLLKHLNAQDPGTVADTISILTTNRNACILIDSDKSHANDTIGATKQRLNDEITQAGGFAWITAGREIENSIPADILSTIVTLDEDAGPYDDIPTLILRDTRNPRKWADKMTLAHEVTPRLTRAHLEAASDLAPQLAILVEHVNRWNGEHA